ncbi:hypothetical protein T4D_11033 [Trichinella pseudospiralis]|uniref:Uncharacterized protein n=1 Tax=Trichinella pseudospiralis TaxID=6337 RepID=A0A0V1FLT7_TRIPS|nr:hypothetical protein T4D_11033 [Trichinella pseudospiralis]
MPEAEQHLAEPCSSSLLGESRANGYYRRSNGEPVFALYKTLPCSCVLGACFPPYIVLLFSPSERGVKIAAKEYISKRNACPVLAGRPFCSRLAVSIAAQTKRRPAMFDVDVCRQISGSALLSALYDNKAKAAPNCEMWRFITLDKNVPNQCAWRASRLIQVLSVHNSDLLKLAISMSKPLLEDEFSESEITRPMMRSAYASCSTFVQLANGLNAGRKSGDLPVPTSLELNRHRGAFQTSRLINTGTSFLHQFSQEIAHAVVG